LSSHNKLKGPIIHQQLDQDFFHMPLIQLPGIQLVAMAEIPLANLVEGTPYLAGKMEYRDSISLEGLSMTTSSVRNMEIKKARTK
jgi:hypothetical protein